LIEVEFDSTFFLFTPGFNSIADSPVRIGELFLVSPENTLFEAPIREMVARRSPDTGEPLPMSPEDTPYEALNKRNGSAKEASPRRAIGKM